MAQQNTQTVQIPEIAKTYGKRPRSRSKSAPDPVTTPSTERPVRARLAWSRSLLDQNYKSTHAAPADAPPVRSMAAVRARAGTPANTGSPNPLEPLLASVAAGSRSPLARDTYLPTPDSARISPSRPSPGHRLIEWVQSMFK